MKKTLLFLAIGILTLTIVSAATYYAIFSTSFVVAPSITLDNEEQELGEVFSGGLIEGEEIVITNDAPSKRIITLSEETECDIETSYTSNVDMNKKNPDTWEIIEGETIILSYTIIGAEFKYKVDTGLENYVVVYYPDLDGNPGSWNIENAQLVGDANTEWTSSEIGILPDITDWNEKAKLWLIPSADWIAQSWNPSEWYFENNLITYADDVTLDAESSITIIPLYEIGVGEEGECIVTTTIA